MSDLIDDDAFSFRRGRARPMNNALVVEMGYGGTFVVQRSDLPTLLDIAARSVRVAHPDVEKSWSHLKEPHLEQTLFIRSVTIETINPPGTAKAELAAEAAAAEPAGGDPVAQAAE